ncbi:MAG: DUF975 family protein [Bacteroidaceae bacterium]|nr:DUF975 family protein [Bacteroidaceae bacterium]
MISSTSKMRQQGATDLRGRWGEAALFTFVYFVIAAIFSGTVQAGSDLFVTGLGSALSILLIPMGWGYGMTFLANHRHEDDDPFSIGHLFDGYRDFVRVFLTLLLQRIYIFLWMLLLIVPGIIKAFSYAMTPYILRDRPDLKYNGAIELSMAMMRGHKADLFWLYLSFIGWFLLCILTLGIGSFWLGPYVQSTVANFYEEVKAEFEGRSFERPIDANESNYSKSER